MSGPVSISRSPTRSVRALDASLPIVIAREALLSSTTSAIGAVRSTSSITRSVEGSTHVESLW